MQTIYTLDDRFAVEEQTALVLIIWNQIHPIKQRNDQAKKKGRSRKRCRRKIVDTIPRLLECHAHSSLLT
jgi:hypothetical protein